MKNWKRILSVFLVICTILSTLMAASASLVDLETDTNEDCTDIFNVSEDGTIEFGSYPQTCVAEYDADNMPTGSGLKSAMATITSSAAWDENAVEYTGMEEKPTLTWSNFTDDEGYIYWTQKNGRTTEYHHVYYPAQIVDLPYINGAYRLTDGHVEQKEDGSLQYADITINGTKYRVIKKNYTRSSSAYTLYGDEIYQACYDLYSTDGVWDTYGYRNYTVASNGIILDTPEILNEYYWFKYEPIKWKVIEEDNSCYKLACESIIDSTYYERYFEWATGGSYKAYGHSDADKNYRAYLSDVFFETAFNDEEQTYIPLMQYHVSSFDSTEDGDGNITGYTLNTSINKNLSYWSKVSFVSTDDLNICGYSAEKTDYVSMARGELAGNNYCIEAVETTNYNPLTVSTSGDISAAADRNSLVNVRPVIYITNSNSNTSKAVRMGSYPQSEVTDAALINNLNALDLEWNDVTSLDYSETTPHAGKYADVEYNGEKYRGYICENWAGTYGLDASDNESSYNYLSADRKEIHWFKYEPLIWTRASDAYDSYYVCNTVIDVARFNTKEKEAAEGDTASKFEGSSLDEFMNGDMINTIFSDEELSRTHMINISDSDINAELSVPITYSYKLNYCGVSGYEISNYATKPSSDIDGFTDVLRTTDYAEWQPVYWGTTAGGFKLEGIQGYFEYPTDWNTQIEGIYPCIKLSHNMTTSERVEPTCTDVGYESTEYCIDCEPDAKGEEIPALGHLYEYEFVWLYQANEDGSFDEWLYDTFADEDGELDNNRIMAINEDDDTPYFLLKATLIQNDGTVMTEGEDSYEVKDIDKIDSNKISVYAPLLCAREDDDLLGFGTVNLDINKQEATCESDGSLSCTAEASYDNDETKSDTLSFTSAEAGDHEYINPTDTFTWSDDKTECTATYYCKYNSEHTLDKECNVSTSVEFPTCTEDGYYIRKATSTLDGVKSTDTQKTVINKLGHCYKITSWNWSDDCSSCTAVFTCHQCQAEETAECTVRTINNIGTCVTDGSTVYIAECTFDGIKYTDVKDATTPASGHNLVIDEAVEPTCTTSGLTEGMHCSACGKVIIKQEVIEHLGHDAAEPVKENEKAATCSECGSYDMVTYCKRCQTEIRRDTVMTPMTSHNYVRSVIKNASCNEEGVIRYTCSKCGAYYEEKTPGTAHNYTMSIVKEPTCSSEGIRRYTCTNCGSYYEEKIDKTAHVKGTPVKEYLFEPTCTTNGFYDLVTKCTVCGAEVERQRVLVPATDHNYEISYAWSSDNSTCTGTAVCKTCKKVVSETASASCEITTEATASGSGIKTFTAEFKNSLFKTQTVTASYDLEKEEPTEPVTEPVTTPVTEPINNTSDTDASDGGPDQDETTESQQDVIPVTESNKNTGSTIQASADAETEVPDTGDSNSVMIFLLIAVMSAASAAAVLVTDKKKKEN